MVDIVNRGKINLYALKRNKDKCLIYREFMIAFDTLQRAGKTFK